MAIWAYPFVSVNKDRAYGPEDFMQFYANLFSTGVLATAGLPGYTGFKVIQTTTASMNLIVDPGVAIIEGGQVMNTAPYSVKVPAPYPELPRTDSIVIRWDKSSRTGGIVYKENSTQVTQADDKYELQIATINVSTIASEISQADITDTRADSKVCGYSSPYQKINVGDLLAQFKSELAANSQTFTTWFTGIKGQLSTDAAGHLQNQINDIGKTKLISANSDLDNYLDNGIFYIDNTGPKNYPSGANSFSILTVESSKGVGDGYVTVQHLYDSTGNEYHRHFAISSFSDWQKTNGRPITADVSVGGGRIATLQRDGRTVTITAQGHFQQSMNQGEWVTATDEEKIPVGFRPTKETFIYSSAISSPAKVAWNRIESDGSFKTWQNGNITTTDSMVTPSQSWITADALPD